jgi:hypothetical protein
VVKVKGEDVGIGSVMSALLVYGREARQQEVSGAIQKEKETYT